MKPANTPRVIDVQEAQANLEQLVDELGPGESFLISVDGKPQVNVVGLTPEEIERMAKAEE